MTAIRQVQGCGASVMSFAVLSCTVICLVQFVYVQCLSALQGLVSGHKKRFESSILHLNTDFTQQQINL